MIAVSIGCVLLTNSAFASEFSCGPGKGRPPTDFNWGASPFDFSRGRKAGSEERTGKLAFTVTARKKDDYSFIFKTSEQAKISLRCILFGRKKVYREEDIEYDTYFVDFPVGSYFLEDSTITDNVIEQRNHLNIKFDILPGRVTYLGSYNIIYAPVPLENKYLHFSMGKGGWRLDVSDEQDRDFKAIDPENAYAATIDDQVPRP